MILLQFDQHVLPNTDLSEVLLDNDRGNLKIIFCLKVAAFPFYNPLDRLAANAPINVNPVGEGGGRSAGSGWGFDKF